MAEKQNSAGVDTARWAMVGGDDVAAPAILDRHRDPAVDAQVPASASPWSALPPSRS